MRSTRIHLLAAGAMVALAAAKDQGGGTIKPPEEGDKTSDFAAAQARAEAAEGEAVKLREALAQAQGDLDATRAAHADLAKRFDGAMEDRGAALDAAEEVQRGLDRERSAHADTAADLKEALAEIAQLKLDLAASPAPATELPKPTVEQEHAARDQLGAAIFHQVQTQERPLSVVELATSLKARFAAVIEAAEAYDFVTLSAPDETGVVALKT